MLRTARYSEDKLTGMMLGMLLGDAIGSRFNDKNPDDIPLLDATFLDTHPPKFYTDDTQMALSVLEEMVENGQIDQASLQQRILKRFTPWREYGGGMLEVIERWRSGALIAETASSLYNGTGNFGDGAAVRIAPISCFFRRNETAELFEQVHRCVLLTHTHPYGIAGAILQAAAVLLALNDVPVNQWMQELFKLPMESAFKIKLGRVAQCLENQVNAHESVKDIGNGSEAIEAVPAALYAAMRNPDSLLDTVFFAVSMGGDCDTIAAMAGAMAGARFGADAIPVQVLSSFENEKEGIDFIRTLIRKATGNR